jgi:hypothetical protein
VVIKITGNWSVIGVEVAPYPTLFTSQKCEAEKGEKRKSWSVRDSIIRCANLNRAVLQVQK